MQQRPQHEASDFGASAASDGRKRRAAAVGDREQSDEGGLEAVPALGAVAELAPAWARAGVGSGEGRADQRALFAVSAAAAVGSRDGPSSARLFLFLLFPSSFFFFLFLVPVPVPLDDVEDGVPCAQEPYRREGFGGGGRSRSRNGNGLVAGIVPSSVAARRRGQRAQEPRGGVPHAGLGVPQLRARHSDQGGERLGAAASLAARGGPPPPPSAARLRGDRGGGDHLRERGPAKPPVPGAAAAAAAAAAAPALSFFFVCVLGSHLVERVRGQGVE